MHTTAKVGLGALATFGAAAAFYHTTAKRRRTIPGASLAPTYSTVIKSQTEELNVRQPGEDTKDTPLEIPEGLKEGEVEVSQWQLFTDKLAAAKDSVSSSLTTLSVSSMLPDWSIGLPDWMSRLQKELNMEPGSLAHEILLEARDPAVNPEVNWDASVRLSPDLCDDERRFLVKRRQFTRQALASYLDIPVEDIHEDDVPIIATTGSGGGLRALVASTGYYSALKKTGLFDCVTYTAGVSGTCWLQSLYMSSIGQQSFDRITEHVRDRINVHIAYPPAALELLDVAPTNKYLLRGLVEKLKMGSASLGMVDLYGLLVGARLLVPKDERSVNNMDLKMSNQRMYIDDGSQPMPIYTAVRHEIPTVGAENEVNRMIDQKEKEEAIEEDRKDPESFFQWFEMSPYEVYCEDLEAGIPTWSLGRIFESGKNVNRDIPELKLPILFGIFGSAFCATLSHYYQEIRPFITSISFLGRLDEMVLQVNDKLTKVHAIDPATVPNFVKGLGDSLPPTCPRSLHDAETIQLMDAGMSNNLGCYPLMRKGRDVDIVIAFDSSADIQTANWIWYTSGYAKQKKIEGWPVSLGWPQASSDETVKQLEEAQAKSTEEAQDKLDQAKARNLESPDDLPTQSAEQKATLGPLTVWVGSKATRESENEPPPDAEAKEDWQLMNPEAGIVVAYLPLIPNPKVPDANPETSPYMSTWNMEWKPEDVDATLALAKANFEEGAERLKKTVRAVYERKKRLRLRREQAMNLREAGSPARASKRLHQSQDQFS